MWNRILEKFDNNGLDQIDEYLLNSTQWTEKEIEKRSKLMARKAYYEVWLL